MKWMPFFFVLAAALVGCGINSGQDGVKTAVPPSAPTTTSTPSPVPPPPTLLATLPPTASPTITPSPTATPLPPFPVYDGAPLDFDKMGVQIHIQQVDQPPLFAHLQNLGVGWVKTQVSWKLYQPFPDQFSDDRFAELDEFIRLADDAGLKVMLSVAKAPEWSRPITEMDGPPGDYALYGTFMRRLATRYQGKVAAYELWNEPNLQREWNGSPLSAADFAALMRVGATAVREADPAALIISGAPAVTGINDGVTAVDDRLFMRQLLEAGAADFVDGIGVHPYGWANPPDSKIGDSSPAISHNDHPSFFFRRTLDDYAALLTEFGAAQPLWATEFGWGSFDGLNAPPPPGVEYMNQVGEWQQALYTLRAFEMGQEQTAVVAPMILWNLNFGPLLGADFAVTGYSILRPSGAPRPVYLTIQNAFEKGR